MWDSNPRAFQHHDVKADAFTSLSPFGGNDLDQELVLVVGLLTYKPQRGPVTTWVILLKQTPVCSIMFVAVWSLRKNLLPCILISIQSESKEVALIGNRTRVYGVENRNSTTKL